MYHFTNQLNYFTQKQSIAKKVLVEIMINIAKTDLSVKCLSMVTLVNIMVLLNAS